MQLIHDLRIASRSLLRTPDSPRSLLPYSASVSRWS